MQVTIEDAPDSEQDDEIELDVEDEDERVEAARDDVWHEQLHPNHSRFGEALPSKTLDPQDAEIRRKAMDTIGKINPKSRRAYDNKTTPGTSILGLREEIKDSEAPALAMYMEIEGEMRNRALDNDQFEQGHKIYNEIVSQPRYDNQRDVGRKGGVYRAMTPRENEDYTIILTVDYFWAQRFRYTCSFDEFHTVRSLSTRRSLKAFPACLAGTLT